MHQFHIGMSMPTAAALVFPYLHHYHSGKINIYLHNIDQVKLTCTTKINALPVTSYEIDAICGNYQVCIRQMQEADFV